MGRFSVHGTSLRGRSPADNERNPVTTGLFSTPDGLVARETAGVPVVGYARTPGVPAVTLHRGSGPGPMGGASLGSHAHDFLVLAYVEQGEVRLRVDARTWSLRPGDVLVIAPGTVVTPLDDARVGYRD